MHFVKGEINSKGIWTPLLDLKNNETGSSLEKIGIVIEYPIAGEYTFEMVAQNGRRYTVSHF